MSFIIKRSFSEHPGLHVLYLTVCCTGKKHEGDGDDVNDREVPHVGVCQVVLPVVSCLKTK